MYLKWAEELNKHQGEEHDYQHAGFAVLLIGFCYFESISIFIKGRESNRNETGSFFEESFNQVFKNDLVGFAEGEQKLISKIAWKDGRCGMFHIGSTRSRIFLDDGDGTKAVYAKPDDRDPDNKITRIRINRYKFIEAIRTHFDNFIKGLKDSNDGNEGSLKNFVKGWNALYNPKINLAN